MTLPVFWRRLRVGATALAAAGIVALGAAAPASAVTNSDPALIDPTRTAALHVHKFEQPVRAGEAGNGLEEDTTSLTPLAGIEFQVHRVDGIDLTTNTGWQDAAKLTTDEAIARATADGQTGTTDATGLVDFTDLPLGLYVVSEHLTGEQMRAGITGSAPFIVALPLTHPTDRNTWMYDVHVYPKNNVDAITKNVTDGDATTLGDVVTWTIDGSIPAGGATDRYTITDTLDKRLAYQQATVTIHGDTSTSITAEKDYTVIFSDGILTVDFTASGRDKLNQIKQENPAATVRVTLETIVQSLGADGIIPNQATLFPNASTTEGIPSNQPETRWGGIDIQKVNQQGNPLAGAEFQVYRTEDDARTGKNALDIDGTTSWTTSTDGLVHIDGLRLSNWADGTELDEDDWQYYWVAETTAPDGYELLADPLRVAVLDNDRATIELTVENVPHNAGFTLPLTGAEGTWIFLTAGAGLLLAAAGLSVWMRTRRDAAATV